MASLAKPMGAGDTKKVRRLRKKLEGKAMGGSISTTALLRQCREVGVCVKPLLTPHLERHGRAPTLSSKEVRQLVLHCASGSPPPRAAEIRNLPAVRGVLVVAVTGAAVTSGPPAAGNGGAADLTESSAHLTVPPLAFNAQDGFSDAFKQKFRLRAGLRISSGGHSTVGQNVSTNGKDGGSGGGWLKSLADALLYAPLGEDREACPDGPFSGKRPKNAGGNGGRKKKRKGNAKRRRKEAERQNVERGQTSFVQEGNGAHCAQSNGATYDGDDEGVLVDPDKYTDSDAAKDGGEGEDEGEGEGEGEEDEEDLAADNTAEDGEGGEESEREQGGGDSDDGEVEEDDGVSSLPGMDAYILTATQLKENGFPLPRLSEDGAAVATVKQSDLCGASLARVIGEIVLPTTEEADAIVKSVPKLADLEGHVQTQPLSDVGAKGDSAAGRTFGLDCEMCVTEDGLELTRVTLVDAQHRVLLDQLVKPDNRIVDYVTRWSGITAQLLENVNTKLPQVQAAILRIVSADDVLVGHSLENDLKALKMVHLRCLDTSLLYPHQKKGRRSSLRFLVSMYLQRTIQGSDHGHNSAEDAIAALELAQLKVSKGPNFGAERSTDSIFDRLHRNRVPCTMVAASEQCQRHAAGAVSTIPSFSDDGVVQTVLKELQRVSEDQRTGTKPPLVWAELEGPKPPSAQEVCAAAASSGSAGVQTFVAGMDAAGRAAGHERRITRLLDELAPGVVVLVASQGVNPELPRKLDKQRKACLDRRCASVWSVEQGRLLEALESRARDGCTFVTVT